MGLFIKERMELVESWRSYLRSIENFITKVESGIHEATRSGECTGQMCRQAENLMEELERALEAFGRYPWRNKDDDIYIRKLKQLLNDLYSTVYTARRFL